MSLEAKGPKPGTKLEKVLKYLNAGVSYRQIPQIDSSLSYKQVDGARREINRREYGSFSAEPYTDDWKDAVRRGMGSIWGEVGEYIKMGMNPKEISEAALYEKRVDLNPKKIGSLIHHTRTRTNLIPPPSLADRREQLIHARDSLETIQDRVEAWLNMRSLLSQQELADSVQGRFEWMVLLSFQESRNAGEEGTDESLNKFNAQFADLSEEAISRLMPCFKAVHDSKFKKDSGEVLSGNGAVLFEGVHPGQVG